MAKTLLSISLFNLAIMLIGGIFMPHSFLMWLSSSEFSYTLIRATIMIIIIGLLITNPPRNAYFKAVASVLPVSLIAWCIGATYSNQMQLVDMLSLLPAGVASAIVALERDYEAEENLVTNR